MKLWWLILLGINAHTLWMAFKADHIWARIDVPKPPRLIILGGVAKLFAVGSSAWCITRLIQ